MIALVERPRLGWLRLSGLGDIVSDLASAIARFEGYNLAGSVAQRNNNPGNLRAGVGQVGTDASGYAIFPDASTGWAALQNQVSLNISRGLSLNEFFAGKPGVYSGYAPAADANQPYQYAGTVAGWLGISASVPLSQYAAAPLSTPDIASPDLTSGAGDATGGFMASLAPQGLSPGAAALIAIGGLALLLVVT
jgi:hypothetical protein